LTSTIDHNSAQLRPHTASQTDHPQRPPHSVINNSINNNSNRINISLQYNTLYAQVGAAIPRVC